MEIPRWFSSIWVGFDLINQPAIGDLHWWTPLLTLDGMKPGCLRWGETRSSFRTGPAKPEKTAVGFLGFESTYYVYMDMTWQAPQFRHASWTFIFSGGSASVWICGCAYLRLGQATASGVLVQDKLDQFQWRHFAGLGLTHPRVHRRRWDAIFTVDNADTWLYDCCKTLHMLISATKKGCI